MRFLVVGGTGFVGSAVVRNLVQRPDGQVRVLVRSGSSARCEAPVGTVEVTTGDLLVPASLVAAVRGVDVVVHCAHAGPASSRPGPVSIEGTRDLCAAAAKAGVARIVLLSTTAVYGAGPHHDLVEDALPRRPASALSRARAAAEDLVLASGGLVLRAPLTLGTGDRWVVPTALRMQARVGWIEGGQPLQSLIHVDDLAAAAADLADLPALAARVLHIGHPSPVPVRALLERVATLVGMRLRRTVVDRARAERDLDPRRVELLALEHTYRSAAGWELLGRGPRLGPMELTAADVAWYARVLDPAGA